MQPGMQRAETRGHCTGPLLALSVRGSRLRQSGDQEPDDARIIDGANAGEVSRLERQAEKGRVPHSAGSRGVQPAAAFGGSDSDERILDLPEGRRAATAARRGRGTHGQGEG